MRRSFVVAPVLLFIALPLAASGTITVNAFNPSGPEGNAGTQFLQITFTRPVGSNFTVTGDYKTVDGTATIADNDYVGAAGSFVIPAGQTSSAPVAIGIVGDTKVEANETFTMEISNVQGGTIGEPGPYTFTIINDDIPVVRVADARVTEGNAGTTALTFNVTLTQPADVAVQASYFTTNGTATAGEDYQGAQSSVTFEPGQVARTVTINVIGDTVVEPNETLLLTVTPPGGTPVTGTGTIDNDDVLPASRVTIVSGNNQQGTLGKPLAQPLVVQVLDAENKPVAGAVVQWTEAKGTARREPASSTTGADGRASTTVTPTSVGPIEIQATVGGLAPVTFSISSQTSFASRSTGPVAVPIARVLDGICARNEETFSPVCNALSALSDAQLTPTLERVAPQESGAQSKVASEVVSAVTGGIGARLSALRSGVDRFSVQQLAFFDHGRAIPIGMLAQALFTQDAQTDAGGTDESGYNGWSAFVSGNIGSGERVTHPGELGFDLKSHGIMFGVDRMAGENIFGASLNFMQLDSDLSDSAGSVDTTGYALSLYASRGGLFASKTPGAKFDGLHLDGSLTLGRNNYEAEHVVDIPGMPLSRAKSDNDANVFAVAGGTGFEAHRGRTDFDASLSGTWSRANIDDLTEEGDGPLILFVQGHEIESLVATAGINVRSAFPISFGTLLPSFRAEMIHEFKGGARLVTAHFLRDHLETSFTVPLDRPDSNYGKLSAGLQGVFAYGYSASIEVTQDVLRSDLHFRTLQFNVLKSF